MSRRRLVEQFVERYLRDTTRILDLGCGTGSLLPTLARYAPRTVGLDLRIEGLADARRTALRPDVIQADATSIPLRAGRVQAVTMLDILEHVDDHGLMHEAWRVLEPGGTVLGMTPAFDLLWGERDIAAGHLRRYRRAGLGRLIRETGFQTIEMRYFQFTLFPLLAAMRMIGRDRRNFSVHEERPSVITNAILRSINNTETSLGSVIPWPWGTSLIFAARKVSR